MPRKLSRFRKTWLDAHPGWEHHLWTDSDNRAFLQKHYAWFLPIYDNYRKKIMQVDAVRYFLLHHFGGVYADLDLECLRPIESLLEGKQVIIGCEPPQHMAEHGVEKRGAFDKILSNAFMASVPEHPFWEHLANVLPSCCDRDDPLVATGPFFLTRAGESYEDKKIISIEPHEVWCPLDKSTVGNRRYRREVPGRAYTIHHWRGSWWTPACSPAAIAGGILKKAKNILRRINTAIRPWLRRVYIVLRPSEAFRYFLHWGMSLSSQLPPLTDKEKSRQLAVTKMAEGECIARASVDLDATRTMLEKSGWPLVSCLMITRERLALAQRAIQCFRKQVYPNKELVIVDDDPRDDLARWVNDLHDPQIQHLKLPDEGKPLGELREISLHAAHGDYVSQWDDDDISHPERLLVQMLAMSALHADAAFLHRQLIWQPDQRRLGISARCLLENTMIAKKEKLGSYRFVAKGEDTPLVRELIRKSDFVLCDQPELYVYVFHGNNTWDQKHFAEIWGNASRRYAGSEYDRVLTDLQKDLDIVLDKRAPTFARAVLHVENMGTQIPTPPAASSNPDTLPRLLVLVPVKNAMPHLQRCIDNLNASTYPKDRLSLAFLESDSDDGTCGEMEKLLPPLRGRYARVEWFKHDFGYRTSRPRWEISEQFTRRSILAKSRNLLLNLALRDEQWVLWMDVDLLRWPTDAIECLLSVNEDIVVPHCIKPDGETFDLNTFVLKENAEQLDWSRYVCDGILQPPVGYGRRYLGEFSGQDRVEVDGVGGTMLLIRADIHRQGLVYPACPFDFYIETEGLARMAKKMGYSPCGLPGLTIVHS